MNPRVHAGRIRRVDQRGRLGYKAGVLAVALLVGAVGVVYSGVLPGQWDLSQTAPWHSTHAPPVATAPHVDLRPPAVPAPVLGPVMLPAGHIGGRALHQRLHPLITSRNLGPHLGFAVAVLGSAASPWQPRGPTRVTPASTLKLLTTTAALELLGDAHRFTTSVVQGRTRAQIVLVGGGDPLLIGAARKHAGYPRPASLAQLARRTAEHLRREGRRRVRLSYDTSLFSGPAVNPAWPPTYIPESVVSPITPLWVDEGRVSPNGERRVHHPARVAANRFAALLRAAGVRVLGPPRPTTAPLAPVLVAQVRSAPLGEIVEHILEQSDNEGAEVLLRQVAVAGGRPGSASQGVSVVRSTLTRLGVNLPGARLYDGSGLSRRDRVPVRALIQVLQLDASPQHPELRPVLAGLPVAGFSGTLAYRFSRDAKAGAGEVRAKTGTLTGVDGLAGVAAGRGGQRLVFVAVADRVPVAKTLAARTQLDRIAAALATCRC